MNPVEHNPAIHPVEPEEVMAFRDGELEPDAAARVAAHLSDCTECARLAGELNAVSQQLQAWPVSDCPEAINRLGLKVESANPPSGFNFRVSEPKARRRFVLPLLATAAIIVILAVIIPPNLLRSKPAERRLLGAMGTVSRDGSVVMHDAPAASAEATTPVASPRDRRVGELLREKEEAIPGGIVENAMRQVRGPMVIGTVGLVIVAEDFAKARATLDRILAAHSGFAAQLSVTDEKGSAQSLTATLRVPAEKLAAAVTELKKLGRVENETHNGEEVTQQYTDLNARLSNARNTEQRLIAVLQQRTGKVRDILEVEQEIARVREEIERMDAQRRTMENQVQLATIQLQIREDYKASLQVTPPTTGTHLWNALASGIKDAAGTVLSLVMFVLEAGPTLLLWTGILFWPARVAWRRFRPIWNVQNLA